MTSAILLDQITQNGIRSVRLWARKRMFEKMCETKKQFFTQKDCDAAVYTITKKTTETGMRSYQCPFCGWWHYGHEPGFDKNQGVTE